MRIRSLFAPLVRGPAGRLGLAVLLALLAPAAAVAQTAPPVPGLRRTAAPWVGYLVIFVLLVLVLAVSIIPSKRGHQD